MLTKLMDYQRLSKTIAFALRHKPWVFELELDKEGWVDLDTLIHALRNNRDHWTALSEEDIRTMMDRSDKDRYEVQNGRIRARYGHSKENSIKATTAIPPRRLLHGTTHKTAKQIMETGLLPMSRQFVHLSTDRETAKEVGKRKGEDVVIIEVSALRASHDGISFYKGNEKVWLSGPLPSKYLSFAK